jgi:hypothetical protein
MSCAEPAVMFRCSLFAANISAFTLGSALGIWLGGLAIDGGLGIASVNWVGGLISLSGQSRDEVPGITSGWFGSGYGNASGARRLLRSRRRGRTGRSSA